MTDYSSSFGFLVNQSKRMVEQPCIYTILVPYDSNANKVNNTHFVVSFTHVFKVEENAVVSQLEQISNFLFGIVDVGNQYQTHSHSIIFQRFTSVARDDLREGN